MSEIMHEIRCSAIYLVVREYARFVSCNDISKSRGWAQTRDVLDHCMKKEYAAGEHQGAQNPYC